MGYKLELDLPNAGQGVEVYVDGLGILENGKTHDIDDEQAQAFRVAHRTYKSDTDPDTGIVTNVEEIEGPTVLEYFKGTEGITVTTDKKAAETKKEREARQKKEAAPTPEDPPPATGTVDEEDEPVGLTDGGPQSLGSALPVVSEDNKDAADGSGKQGGGDGQ
jgi:hypothetical protein